MRVHRESYEVSTRVLACLALVDVGPLVDRHAPKMRRGCVVPCALVGEQKVGGDDLVKVTGAIAW